MSIYNVACSVNTFRKYSSIFYYRHANVRPMTGLRKATTARNLKHFYKCVHQLQGIPFPLRRQCSSCITLLAALTGHQCNFIAQQSNGIVIHRGPLIRLHKNTVPKQSVHQSLKNSHYSVPFLLYFPKKGRLPLYQVVESFRPAIARAYRLAQANIAYRRFSFFFKPQYTVFYNRTGI